METIKVSNVEVIPDATHLLWRHVAGTETDADCPWKKYSTEGDVSGHRSPTYRAETIKFDVENINAPIANMFRRLMITEVPVLAFDRVLIEENDGVVPDEVLCHRIGLIPLAGPVTWMKYITDSHSVTIDNLDPAHVLVFELDVEGQHGVQATSVYSGDLKWRPLRSQEEVAAKSEDNRVFLVHPDIVLTRLGPGQRLKLRAIAIKGIGVVHAKWSPVAACFYEIRHEAVRKEEETRPKRHSSRHLRHDADNEEAEDVDLGSPASARGANNVSTQKGREIVRFTVESVGQLSAADVFRHALRLFIERMRDLVSQVRLADPHMPGGSVV